MQPAPAIAILPLGTGNDLSRVLGWGKQHDSNTDFYKILRLIELAKIVNFDRFERIKIEYFSK